MNRKITLLSAVAALALSVAGCASTSTPTVAMVAVTTTDQFVPTAAVSGTFEVWSSKLALQRSHNPQVRRFAQQMIKDHTAAGHRLEAVANRLGLSAPTSLDATRQALYDSLKTTSDADFDAAYVHTQLGAHQEAVSLFSSYASNGDNPALKRFAASTLPTLEMHLKHAEALSGAPNAM